jgi:hypothetical protein
MRPLALSDNKLNDTVSIVHETNLKVMLFFSNINIVRNVMRKLREN